MRFLLLLIVMSLLTGCARQSDWVQVNDPALMPPEPVREFRGLWVATVANIDWPSEPGLSASAQQVEALRILDLAQELNLNAIVLQIRPMTDAFYDSRLEPWSAFLTGQEGQDPGYDPLRFWIDESHARGLELHAWINPFRAGHPSHPGEPHASSFAAKKPEYLVQHGDYLWLDPGDERARDHSLSVIHDIVRRYDIDGIHVDDYFYPYPIDGEPLDDARSYAEFQKSGGALSRSDWRRWNIDRFVRDMYAETKRIKPHVLVGISPFGIWRPGHPEGIVGFDAYEQLGADARRWLREGWLDYASPQLYWKIESEGQPFEPLLDWWTGENVNARHLWPGLYLTRIQSDDGWAPSDITKQIKIIQKNENASGFILFSAIGLVEDRQDIQNALTSEVLSAAALVPRSGWLAQRPIRPPKLRFTHTDDDTLVQIKSLDPRAGGWHLVTRHGRKWKTTFHPRSETTVTIPMAVPNDEREAPVIFIAARAIGPAGETSETVVYTRRIPPPALPARTAP